MWVGGVVKSGHRAVSGYERRAPPASQPVTQDDDVVTDAQQGLYIGPHASSRARIPALPTTYHVTTSGTLHGRLSTRVHNNKFLRMPPHRLPFAPNQMYPPPLQWTASEQ